MSSRKSKVTLVGLSPDLDLSDPNELLSVAEAAGVNVPEFARVAMLVSRPERRSLLAVFYEERSEFVLYYTKFLLFRRKQDMVLASFARALGKGWSVFHPPTVIGVDLETTLRDVRL